MEANADLSEIFTPDVFTQSQWRDLHESNCHTGEQRLALAILRDALLCLVRPCGKPGPASLRLHDAMLWLRGAKDCYISFEFVCEALNIDDPDGFQQRLLAAVGHKTLNTASYARVPW